MRLPHAIAFPLLAVGSLAAVSCGPTADAPKLSVSAPSASAKDEDRIQGRWVCFEYSEDGVRAPAGGGVRAVFTEREAKIGSEHGAMAYQYRLHSGESPKRCELIVPGVFTRRIAYKLEGDLLILASHLAEDQDTPAPKSLEPAPGISVSKLRRLEPGMKLSAKEEKPSSADEEVALAVLRQQLAAYRELFEQQKYDQVIEEMIALDTRRKLKESPQDKEQFVARMKQMGPAFAQLLGVIETQRPQFTTSRNRATYDIRLIHFDGLPGMPHLSFQKEGDAWLMMEQ